MHQEYQDVSRVQESLVIITIALQLEPLEEVTVQYEEDDIEITDDKASSDAFAVSSLY